MKKNFKTLKKEFDDFFTRKPTKELKSWSILHDFYHQILTCMDEKNITKAELAKKMKKSRSAISQMLNTTPNISINKMVELADAIGVEINLSIQDLDKYKRQNEQKYFKHIINIPADVVNEKEGDKSKQDNPIFQPSVFLSFEANEYSTCGNK